MRIPHLKRPDLPPDELEAIEDAGIAMADYISAAVGMRTTAFCAIKFAWVPLIGRFFLAILDLEVARARKLWAIALDEALLAANVSGDRQFVEFAISEARRDIDTDWPPPRTIRLPSDLEPIHVPGEC